MSMGGKYRRGGGVGFAVWIIPGQRVFMHGNCTVRFYLQWLVDFTRGLFITKREFANCKCFRILNWKNLAELDR